ncbi:MAG: methyltransferase domain-containing protein [Anaerolineales bacterium]|nr:methyltransferase domain-containing protein [Anaerolineales bacterium]
MQFEYQETSKDLETRINIHEKYGSRDIDQWMLEILEPETGSRILDVGCGAGKQLRAFYDYLQSDCEITGGDISEELLDQAKELNKKLGNPFTLGKLDFDTQFPHDDGSFDLTSCCFAIYYAKDIPFTIREMHRVLVPGGRLFTTGPMPENKQLFYEVIQAATGKEIPPMPGSSRYSTEIFDAIQSQFSSVERHIFENPLVFDEVQPFIDYTRASLSEDRRLWSGLFTEEDEFEEVMDRIEGVTQQKYDQNDGKLVMTKVVGGFVAHK